MHFKIPMTLDASECTAFAGYSNSDGIKVGAGPPELGVTAIFYDLG
jgi:hypothetical protein